jgi:hypothetical protein
VRKAAFGLVFFLLIACSGSSTPDETGEGSRAASGGEDASGGGSGESEGGGGGKAGGSGTGGTSTGGGAIGGSASGGSNQGGSELGGTSSGGSAGDGTGESGGGGGSFGATAGTGGVATAGTAGSSGGGSSSRDPVCDPATGELDSTPYPDCEPRSDNPCELCIQASCCEESKKCYGYDPANVCGWGGPTAGDYGGLGEIDCYLECAREYVAVNGIYDDRAADLCVPACTTPECGLIGNATQDLVVCLEDNCDDECFAP